MITVLSPETITARTDAGLILPGVLAQKDTENLGGITSKFWVVDCGDDRHLSAESFGKRRDAFGEDVLTEGYFGGAAGVAVIDLASRIAMFGVEETKKHHMHTDIGSLAIDISSELKKQKVILNLHSDENKEGNGQTIIHTGDLGCAFMAMVAQLVGKMGETDTVEEAQEISQAAGQNLPLNEATKTFRHTADLLGPTYQIEKSELVKGIQNYRAPVPVILAGSHADPKAAAVYVSFDPHGIRTHNYKHSLNGMPRYTHSVTAPERFLTFMEGRKYSATDIELLQAQSLLLGVATTRALRGASNGLPYEVIL